MSLMHTPLCLAAEILARWVKCVVTLPALPSPASEIVSKIQRATVCAVGVLVSFPLPKVTDSEDCSSYPESSWDIVWQPITGCSSLSSWNAGITMSAKLCPSLSCVRRLIGTNPSWEGVSTSACLSPSLERVGNSSDPDRCHEPSCGHSSSSPATGVVQRENKSTCSLAVCSWACSCFHAPWDYMAETSLHSLLWHCHLGPWGVSGCWVLGLQSASLEYLMICSFSW